MVLHASPAELEARLVIEVLHHGSEIVHETRQRAPQQGPRDDEMQGRWRRGLRLVGLVRLWITHARGRTIELPERSLKRREEEFVALHQRRRVSFER